MSTEPANSEQGPNTVRDEPGLGLLGALVEAERASMDPPADGERQTWKRVVASVAVGGPPPVPPSSISGPATTLTSVWVKIVLGVVIGGVVAAAGYRLANEPEPAATTVARSGAEPREAPPSPAQQPKPMAPRAEPPAPEHPAAVAAPEPPANVPDEAFPRREARAAPPEPGAPPASDLAEETRLLARARARLRAGSSSNALAPLTEHARRFPQGQLTEDRMVLRAQALCESGDIKAGRREAAALRKAFPESSHLPRVTRSCNP